MAGRHGQEAGLCRPGPIRPYTTFGLKVALLEPRTEFEFR